MPTKFLLLGEGVNFIFMGVGIFLILISLDTMRPEMITQISQKQVFCDTDALAIGKLIPNN